MLEDADAVGLTHGGEAVRDEDRRAVTRGGEEPVEDLGFAPDVELRGRLVEQHDARAELHGAQRARQRDALPLPARRVGAAVVAARQHRVELGQVRRARRLERQPHRVVGAPAGATLSRSGSSSRMKSWNTAVTPRSPGGEIELAQIDAVDLDRARLRVVQPAQQLGERRLARAVLADDGERRSGGNREIEVIEHRRAARVREREIAEADVARRQAGGGAVAGRQRACRTHRRLEAQHRGRPAPRRHRAPS